MPDLKRKYLFITGGVISSLGKGLTLASTALLLEKMGYKIALLKLEPYLNVDPGTMNPFEHGEVYVTDDGAETDLDLGHYFRYSSSMLNRCSQVTSGQIYDSVIKKERKGDYLGKTVQVVPHITDEIKKRIIEYGASLEADVVLVEIGGTVGDIESLPFLEAIRQLRYDLPNSCINVHMTYVPFLKAAGEFKTKPSQHSVQTLRSIGLLPDIIICRCEKNLPEEILQKLSLFCSVPKDAVFEEVDVTTTIAEVPLDLYKQGVSKKIAAKLQLEEREIDLSDWENLVAGIKNPKGTITCGVVGKYLQHKDAYKSVFEALHHGANALGYSLEIKTFESDKIESVENLEGCDGYLVPGGFGARGWEGKIFAAKYCREQKIPFFGICFGMQVLCVEFARNVADLKSANSTEIDATTPQPIIARLVEQENVKEMGGTMRLGAYPCRLKEGSRAHQVYQKLSISERHRHRYEFNNKYRAELEAKGLIISGVLENGNLCEIVEIEHHPWMVGVQFHPEFKSKPVAPHPLFKGFIQAMIDKRAPC